MRSEVSSTLRSSVVPLRLTPTTKIASGSGRVRPRARRSCLLGRLSRTPPAPAACRGYHSPPSMSKESAILFGRGRATSVPPGAQRDPAVPDQLHHPVCRATAHPLDPGQRQVHRLLQQLPADRLVPGHRLGILLGRNGASPRLSPFAFLFAGVVALVGHLQLNIQVQSTDEIFFGLAENRAADISFLFLPLVVGLVVALLATLALPLGPLLKSMWPLKAYAIDISGSMRAVSPPLRSSRRWALSRSSGLRRLRPVRRRRIGPHSLRLGVGE